MNRLPNAEWPGGNDCSAQLQWDQTWDSARDTASVSASLKAAAGGTLPLTRDGDIFTVYGKNRRFAMGKSVEKSQAWLRAAVRKNADGSRMRGLEKLRANQVSKPDTSTDLQSMVNRATH